jgi:WD40 repeat protein
MTRRRLVAGGVVLALLGGGLYLWLARPAFLMQYFPPPVPHEAWGSFPETNTIHHLRYTADGNTLVAVSPARARLYDVATGQLQASLPFSHYVHLASASADGNTVVACNGWGDNATVQVWEVKTRRLIAECKGHEKEITAVALSADGRLLVTGSKDQTVRLWDATTGKERHRLHHAAAIESLALSADGTTLAVRSQEEPVRVWDTDTGKGRLALTGHIGTVSYLALSPDGMTVALGAGGVVRLWDVAKAARRLTIRVPTLDADTKPLPPDRAALRWLEFSPDGTILALVSDEGVRLYDAGTGKERVLLPVPLQTMEERPRVSALAFTPGGTGLAVAHAVRYKDNEDQQFSFSRNYVRFWGVPGKRPAPGHLGDSRAALPEFPEHLDDTDTFGEEPEGYSAGFGSLAYAPDGKTLATTHGRSSVALWDVATRQRQALFSGHKNFVQRVRFSPDGNTLASAGLDETVKLWDTRTGKELRTLRGHDRRVYCLAFAPDGKLLVSGDAVETWRGQKHQLDGHHKSTVRLWDVDTGRERQVLRVHGNVRDVAISANGKVLAATHDLWVTVWELSTGKVLATFEQPSISVFRSVVLTPDGKTLAVGTAGSATKDNWLDSSIVHVYDIDRKALQAKLNHGEPTYGVWALALSPDGRVLASAAMYDNTVKLWDLATHRELAVHQVREGRIVQDIAFAPDGKTVAIGYWAFSGPGRVLFWDVATVLPR